MLASSDGADAVLLDVARIDPKMLMLRWRRFVNEDQKNIADGRDHDPSLRLAKCLVGAAYPLFSGDLHACYR